MQEMKLTDSGIAYFEKGEGDKTVVLVHGSFVDSTMWGMYVEPLVAAGYAVVGVDLAGHGQSEADLSKVDMDTYAQNVSDVVAAVGADNPILIGHSMSGLTVLTNAQAGLSDTIISIDPSPSLEVQGEKSDADIPDVFSIFDAGMPTDQPGMMSAMHDVEPQMLMQMKNTVGNDSGPARRQRKRGISISKEKLDNKKILFVAASDGKSLPFGISVESTKAMAEYYGKPIAVIDGATHPGILIGTKVPEAVKQILEFLKDN